MYQLGIEFSQPRLPLTIEDQESIDHLGIMRVLAVL